MQVPVHKELWDKTNGNVGVWSRERFTVGPGKENGGLCPTKSPLNSSEGFGKAFLEARWGGHPRVYARLKHSSLTGWRWSVLRYQKVWGPCAQDHQADQFFHLAVAFSIWERLRYRYLGTSAKSDSRGYRGGICAWKAPGGPAQLQTSHEPSLLLFLLLLAISPAQAFYKHTGITR